MAHYNDADFEVSEPQTGGSYAEKIPADVYPAVCIGVYLLGEEAGSAQFPAPKEKLWLAFELEDLIINNKDGLPEPAVVGKKFTRSIADQSKLRPFLKSWRGVEFSADELKAFSVIKLLGASALLTIAHNPSKDGKKTYVDIVSISPLPKKQAKVKPINTQLAFSVYNFSAEQFSALPKFIADMVSKTLTFKGLFPLYPNMEGTPENLPKTDAAVNVQTDDDLPF